jgi:y4mF family transcriptional regulator
MNNEVSRRDEIWFVAKGNNQDSKHGTNGSITHFVAKNKPYRVYSDLFLTIIHLIGYKTQNLLEIIPDKVYYSFMNMIGTYIKAERKKAGLTQEEFAMRAGLGLRFVRELEQGKETVRLDKVNQALAMFGMVAVPGKMEKSE